jgi:7-cyano-7-deazaguanine synthase in queuosine biosynthesis
MTAVVVNDCAAVAGAVQVRWKPTSAALPANWTFAYDRVANRVPNTLTPAQQDWLEVFGAVYAIDRVSPRPDGTSAWNREIAASIPVRDPDLWNAAAPALRNLFNLLTGDRLDATFYPEQNPVPSPSRTDALPKDPTGVALLSGGLDSTAAVAGLLAAGGRPMTVAHENNTAARASIGAVRAELPLPANGHCTISSKGRSGGGLVTGDSQRARSALYVSTAIAVADAWTLPTVTVGENGVMAVHLPATEARLGSLSTRTAHPEVLNQIAGLAGVCLGSAVTVDNPLEHLTKAETVRLLDAAGHGALVPQTVSCWNSRTPSHCGYCVPCVQRQIAVEAAGTADAAYTTRSADALPTGAVSAATAHDNLVHLKTLAQDVDGADNAELVYLYPELLVASSRVTGADRVALYRRWAGEALAFFDAHPYSAGV